MFLNKGSVLPPTANIMLDFDKNEKNSDQPRFLAGYAAVRNRFLQLSPSVSRMKQINDFMRNNFSRVECTLFAHDDATPGFAFVDRLKIRI